MRWLKRDELLPGVICLTKVMSRRWKPAEETALAEVKRILKVELAERPQFPEVVGDRRLLRFLRGKSLKVEESVKCIRAFFKWRDENKVDDIRQDIVYGGKDSPFKFPFGKEIIAVAPQIIISVNSLDKKGRPLAMETFDFSPKEMFDAVPMADYLLFLIHTLEYRAIVLEQISHEREQRYLKEHPNPEDREDGYGVIVMDYTIRDLKGVGMAHLGSKGRTLVAAALEAALPNYPEFLDKCVIINTPWIFNTFWYFVKGFLDEITLAKIGLCGSTFMPLLLEDMTIENIPESLGGQFKLYNEPYEFDRSPAGPLYYPGAPACPTTSSAGSSSATTTSSLSALFPDADGATQPAALSATSASRAAAFSSFSTTTAAAVHPHADTSAPTARDRSMVKTRQVSVELMSHRVWKHTLNWIRQSPLKALTTLLFALVFAWVRALGWLQVIAYPTIVFVTIFNTKPVVRRLLQYFDIDYKLK